MQQVIGHLNNALGLLMKATEGLAIKPIVNQKAVRYSVTAENDVRRLLRLLKEKEEPCKP